jgi:hypothetical protein
MGFAIQAEALRAIRGCSRLGLHGVARKAGVVLSLQGEESLYLN